MRPFGFRPTLRIALKSTFIIIGVIMSQISDGNRHVDLASFAELQTANRLDSSRRQLSEHNPDPHAQRYP